MSVPSSNSMTIWPLPSLAVPLIERLPSMLRTADSTFWTIWVSISVGAAPGCEIEAMTTGNSMSGSFCTFNCMNATTPASVSARKRTIGMIGLRMDQAEMLRKFIISIHYALIGSALFVGPIVRGYFFWPSGLPFRPGSGSRQRTARRARCRPGLR